MKSWGVLIVALIAGGLLAWQGAAPPAPRPVDAPADTFSAMRAAQDIAVIAEAPHPTGSPANAAVRDHLLARMTALGLSPRVQRANLLRGPVENVVGVLPGRDPARPAVAIVAHYDSVPGSPGAGDDAAGVASALETVRALKTAGAPARDVAVVITDGEELGLLGARAFFAGDPLAKRIGLVINLEARGGAGRAAMFETSADNGGLIEVFRRAAVHPSSNSLAVFLYQQLPNDTDFTVAREAGVTGFNFAFIGRQFDYHAPTATLANLDLGSVQSMGEQTLGLVRALAFAAELPARRPDVVYSQTFGSLILAYPGWGGWTLAAATAALLAVAVRRATRRERLRGGDIALGALAPLLTLLLAAGALWLARAGTGVGFGFYAQKPLLARFELWEAALASVDAAAVLAMAVLFAGEGARRASLWLGMLALGLAAAVAVQAAEPRIAFVLAWPVGAAALAAAVSALGRDRSWLASLSVIVVAAMSLGWLGTMFHAIAEALDFAPALALFAALSLLSLWPLLAAVKGRRGLAVVALALLVAAGLVGVIRFTDPWSPRFPREAAVRPVASPTLPLPERGKPL